MNAKTNSNNLKTLEQIRKEQGKTYWARLIAEGRKDNTTTKATAKK